MKINKFLETFALSALLMSGLGTLIFTHSSNAEETKAVTDVGEITINEVRNAISDSINVYLLPTQNYALPDSWDNTYVAAGEDDGVFINGEKYNSAVLKYAGTGSAFITLHFALPSAATDGLVVEFKGTFTSAAADCSFSVHYAAQRFSGKWVHALEDYDVVSLADANMPNFENVTINTEDAVGYEYVTDSATLPMKKGFMGLTNNTGSYAFQFYFRKEVQSNGWFEVRIGNEGSWGRGHYLLYKFSTEWNIKGCGFVHECKGTDNIWTPTQLNNSPEFSTNFTSGDNLLEMGTIKVKGTTKKYLVFFKNNGSILWSDYWDLDDAGRTTKVGFYYSQSDAKVTNSIPLTGTEKLSVTSGTNSISLESTNDICPAVSNWNDYFKSVDGTGLKLNGVSFGNNNWNYFKKIDSTTYSLDLSGAGITQINEGDILYIGGLFKAAREVNGVKVLFKALFADNYFRFDGNSWQDLTDEQYAELIADYKVNAKNELDFLVNPDVYDDDNLVIVQGIVNDAKTLIDSATAIDEIAAIVQTAKDDIISNAKTRQQVIEETILASDSLLSQYLETYDVVTTTDLCAVGNLVFRNKDADSYSSGGYDDTTSWLATSQNNLDGNMIFQFNYESTNPLVSQYGAQIYIRMRSNCDDANAYRFDIGTVVEGEAGVALCVFRNNHDEGRITYNANFASNTPYKIECGSIDLDGYARTLLFIKIENEFVIKKIVDSFETQKPTLRIMDSYTTGEEETTISPIDENTTKHQPSNSSLLGRLLLDSNSNKNNLYVTLKENSFPNEAVLLPADSGVFTINGNELNAKRSITNIKKIDETKYRIEFDMTELANNDRVKIGGLFSYLGADFTKSLFRLFDTEFIYHSDTNSWSQALPTDRETILYEAKETLSNYVNKSEYSAENQAKIQSIIDEYLPKLDAAETEQIQSVLNEALGKIDVIPTILGEAKTTAKNELGSYTTGKTYRSEEQAELDKILNDAYSQIATANDQVTINSIVATAKSKIDGLKTAEQRDAEDLLASKKSGKAEVNSLSALLEMDRYSEEDQEKLVNLTYDALANIEKATSEEEVANIVAKYKESIKEVQTTDGSIFDGEKYVKEEKGLDKKTKIIIIACSVGGALLIGGGVTAGILISKKKRRQHNEKA